MNRITKAALRAATIAIAPVLAVTAQPAQALDIVFTETTTLTAQQRHGFQVAAKFWENVFADPITVRMNIGFEAMGPNILGGASNYGGAFTIANIYTRMMNDRKTALDFTAQANRQALNGSNALTMITAGQDAATALNANFSYTDNDNSVNNRQLWSSVATLQALGVTFGPTQAAADINFATGYANEFDYDPSDGIGAGLIDFIGVAIHEIGHALGFTSGVDTYDYYARPNGPGRSVTFSSLQNGAFGEILDLFRYSASDTLNWRPGTEAYFSIDGGDSELFGNSNFSTGSFNGDGRQASHWKANGTCSNFIGIMNPYLCDGTMGTVKAIDLAALDAIGWDLKFNVINNSGFTYTSAMAYAAVPETTTWLQMILGFGLLGGVLRQRRTRKDVAAVA